jgi:SAM-dependent methyltransferase
VAVELADVVGPDGRVVAVDQDAGALAVAGQLVAERNAGNVVLRHGDVDRSDVAPGTADTVVMRHVLAHNGGREQDLVASASSLLRPGGSLLLVDVDLTAFRMRPEDSDWAELHAAYLRFLRAGGNDPSVGLRLPELLAATGLEVDVFRGSYVIMALAPGFRPPAWAAGDAMLRQGCVTDADLRRWGTALERLDGASRRPTMFVAVFVAVGTRG